MKLTKKNLLALQIITFILITLCITIFTAYFPNLPPFLRPFISKGVIELKSENPVQIDNRFLSWFNRDPERNIPTEPNVIVSPADGFIMAIEEVNGTKHVVIEMRYTDVHVQRIPIAGKVIRIDGEGKEMPGNLTIGDYVLEKMLPFQKVTTIATEIGQVVVRQITSSFAKRISVFVEEGQEVKRGQRLGNVLAGSTIVIEMPKIVRVAVKKHQDVFGGETIIASYDSN